MTSSLAIHLPIIHRYGAAAREPTAFPDRMQKTKRFSGFLAAFAPIAHVRITTPPVESNQRLTGAREDAPEKGVSLKVRIQSSGAKGITFRPTVVGAERPKEFRWLGRLILPGIFDGEHRFIIEPLSDEKVPLQQSERFNGILVPLFRSSLDRDTSMDSLK